MAKGKTELTSRDAKQLALIAPHITKTGLKLPANTTYEQCEEAAKSIRLAGRSIMWWLGDLLVFTEAHHGEKFAQLGDLTGYDPGTLANAMSVCKNVEHSRREAALSFEHHKEVSGLKPSEQTKFLEKAKRNGWKRSELRRALLDAGLRKKPKKAAAKRKTKKEKQAEQTAPTTELYEALKKELKAAALRVPSFVEMATSIDEKWDDRLPNQKELTMLEKTAEELRAGLYEVLTTTAQLLGVEAKAAA